ncbi:MAG: efflux RND transporter periplasmic adaptor subunit [Armatimonadota bacterium]|nr:efflux RND transporter periplasmic adaptor subunit [Armatimonadota bacterium]MCX7776784.1 efflux RND transporter periplasmic adaptor subunit [Armatimonadota bacterium]MDW8024581.1 efflux RND transporter periplasmic adaptor subunit [Armatimonadota bacterium]
MKWLARGLIILMLFSAMAAWWHVRRKSSERSKMPLVAYAIVERGDVVASVVGTGVIEPLTVVEVKSKAAGKVLKMPIDVGDFVRKGDLIALIDRDQVGAELRQATAEVDAATARLQQAQTEYQLTAETIDAQIEQVRRQWEAAYARLRQAQKEVELLSAQYKAQLKDAEHALAAAISQLKQAQEKAEAQPRLSRSSIQQAEAARNAAIERLRQLESAIHPLERAEAEAALRQAEATLAAAEQAAKVRSEELRRLVEGVHPQALAQAQASYEQALTKLNQAERNLKRVQELHEKGFVSKRQLEDAQVEYETAKAAFESAKTQLETIKQQQAAELAAAKAQHAEAQAKVNEAKAHLASAKKRLETLTTRQETELRDAQAKLCEAEATLEAAKANEAQVRIAQSELEAARAAVKRAEAQLESVKAQEAQIKVKQLEVEAATAALQEAHAKLRAAEKSRLQVKLRQADLKSAQAQLERALASLDNARTRYNDAVVVAPRDGIVLEKLVEEGTVISSAASAFGGGTTIVKLGDMSEVYVDTQVDETDIISVHVGQDVLVIVDAIPGKHFNGKVVRIDPRTTEEQGVVYVHVRVKLLESDNRLKPGMTTSCEFIRAWKENVLRVPSEAVKDFDGATFVDVLVREKPKSLRNPIAVEQRKSAPREGVPTVSWRSGMAPQFMPRSEPRQARAFIDGREGIFWVISKRVRVGLRGNEYTEIVNGLREGELVVTSYTEPHVMRQQPVGPLGRPRLQRRQPK